MNIYANFTRKSHVPAATERGATRTSMCCRNRLGPFLFPSIFISHEDRYYKRWSCCAGYAYKKLCPTLVYKVIFFTRY